MQGSANHHTLWHGRKEHAIRRTRNMGRDKSADENNYGCQVLFCVCSFGGCLLSLLHYGCKQREGGREEISKGSSLNGGRGSQVTSADEAQQREESRGDHITTCPVRLRHPSCEPDQIPSIPNLGWGYWCLISTLQNYHKTI